MSIVKVETLVEKNYVEKSGTGVTATLVTGQVHLSPLVWLVLGSVVFIKFPILMICE